MLQDSGRSRVIACHSQYIGNILLDYHRFKNINGGKEKWWPGRDMVWVLMGVRGCVAVDSGHCLVTLFFPVWSVKDRSLNMTLRQVTDLLSRAHTWVWAQGRLVALLSQIRLFLDRLIGGGDGGGPCTALSSGLRSRGLESKFGRGSGPHDKRVMGWSCLCLGYKRGVCF